MTFLQAKYTITFKDRKWDGWDLCAMWEIGKCIKILGAKTWGKKPLGKCKYGWQDNIKMGLKEREEQTVD